MRPTFQNALFWIDGKRTISEIAALVKKDLGKVNTSYLLKMMELYKEQGLLEFEVIDAKE